MNGFLEREGYEGVTPYQAENIFRTNIQTAYNGATTSKMTDPEVMKPRPYWQYDAINDSRTRPLTSPWMAGSSRRIPRSGIHGSRPTASSAAVRCGA